jgi:hypothetical protein
MEKIQYLALTIIILTPLVGVVLALRYRCFLKMLEKEETEKRKNFKPMLSERVPYEAYKRIAAKGPVNTAPVRKAGDFLDFILEHSDENNSNNIESNLANVDVGETIL